MLSTARPLPSPVPAACNVGGKVFVRAGAARICLVQAGGVGKPAGAMAQPCQQQGSMHHSGDTNTSCKGSVYSSTFITPKASIGQPGCTQYAGYAPTTHTPILLSSPQRRPLGSQDAPNMQGTHLQRTRLSSCNGEEKENGRM